MGQKANSNILRIDMGNRTWKSKYFEKTKEESSVLVFQDIEIRNFIDRFFTSNGLFLYNCKINRSNSDIVIFVSYFMLLDAITEIVSVNNEISKKITDKNISDFSKISTYFEKKKKLYRIKYQKKINFISHNFISKLIASLNIFLNKKYKIKVILQNLNKGMSCRLTNSEAIEFRNVVMQLRPYHNSSFFKEIMHIFIVLLKNDLQVKILTEFIALKLSQLKKHNYFLTFLKRIFNLFINSKVFKISGVKLKIKGRFNGAPRSNTRLIQIGKVPLQTLTLDINYSCSVSYTTNGTFGVQLWVF